MGVLLSWFKGLNSLEWLSMNPLLDHIDLVCNKVCRSLNLLHCLSYFLPRPLLLLFLNSYILPHLDYCDVVWSSCTKSQSLRLETLMNFACCTVLHRSRHSSASAACSDLGFSTLSSRRKLHLAQSFQMSVCPIPLISFPAFFCSLLLILHTVFFI